MKPDEFAKQLAQIKVEIQQLADDVAPVIAGKTAADFFTENFQSQRYHNFSNIETHSQRANCWVNSSGFIIV